MKSINGIMASLVCMFLCTPRAGAEEPEDTTRTKALDEITVEARAATATAHGLTFTPSKNAKNKAQNAFDLLRFMGMPQITVGRDDNVKTLTGGEVSIFVNGLPASPEELASMKTSDVLEVEYLDHPSDARYQNSPYVLDFTLRQYEWGGYTRLSGSGTALNKAAASGRLYSKFTYRRMTYDASAGYDYVNTHHDMASSREEFSLSRDGQHSLVSRTTYPAYSRARRTSVPVSFRAFYRGSRFTMTNKIGFSFTDIPIIEDSGTLRIDDKPQAGLHYTDSSSSRTLSASYMGYAYLTTGGGLTMSLMPRLSYSNGRGSLFYANDAPDQELIDRQSREHSIHSSLAYEITKQINGNTGITGGIFGHHTYNKVRYTGSSHYTDRLITYGFEPILRLYHNTEKVYIFGLASLRWFENRLNDAKKVQMEPRVELYGSYTPGQKHRIEASFQLVGVNMGISSMSQGVQPINEFTYITGNPHLKEWKEIAAHAGYTWLPSNQFSVSSFANFTADFKPASYVYRPYQEGSAVLRVIENDGYAQTLECGVNVTYAPWTVLKLTGGAVYRASKRRGTYRVSVHPLDWNVAAHLFMGDFYISAYATSRQQTLSITEAGVTEYKMNYGISGGWAKGPWNLRLQLDNPLRSTWECWHSWFSSPLYSSCSRGDNPAAHRSLSLTITYTIGYGHPVDRTNEVAPIEDNKSAVLK